MKPSGGSGGLKTVSLSSLGLKLSKKVVSISEDLTLKVVGFEENEWWRREGLMGLVKKGFLGLERERRELVVVWREREEREERVAEAVAMVRVSERVRVKEGRGFVVVFSYPKSLRR